MIQCSYLVVNEYLEVSLKRYRIRGSECVQSMFVHHACFVELVNDNTETESACPKVMKHGVQ